MTKKSNRLVVPNAAGVGDSSRELESCDCSSAYKARGSERARESASNQGVELVIDGRGVKIQSKTL